ncbi:helix-turn-helix domain-containing protein [Microbispora triticiradicis]|uniref:helix-turn-helix domain-containing protein n=1 Tax=Microbispora triticiradicis TaxID=2200763 RepID=UPI001AD6ACC2|nr:helix-turn-helix transcriptional regulator [Microbispora triticiradicis]MBO4273801.1 helix-turn-helix domain-containing protein [Microbispora triticiradicis]
MASTGRPADPVDPHESPWHLLGAELRNWRLFRGHETQESLAAVAHISPSLLGRYERGKREPSADTVKRLDDILEAGGVLVALRAAATTLADTRRHDSLPAAAGPHADDMNRLRRQLLAGIALTGATAALPLDGLARLRDLVDDRIGPASTAEWEELAWEYAHQMITRPLGELISDLSVDLLALQKAMSRATGDPVTWARVNTRMTFLLAYALGSAGHARESRHWWASARRAAQRADGDMLATVCAFEAIQALYEDRPMPLVLARAEEALAAASGRPCVAAAKALGARANARALIGDLEGAYTDLDEQARVTEQLPVKVTSDYASLFGWPVTRTLHSRSLVYTLTGHPRAAHAQTEAIAAYPNPFGRQAAQVRLHTAMATVRSGDVDGGLDHARTVLAELGPANLTRYVVHTAASVVQALPPARQAEPRVIEYQRMLALPGGSS